MACNETGAPVHTTEMAVWEALGGGNSGIVGNRAHVYGFHRGACAIPPSDYSRRRDPRGPDGPYPDWAWACAGDYHHGGKTVLRARHAVLITRLLDGDPELDGVGEFIGQPWPDKPVIYWAVWEGRRKFRRYTGPGHDRWSHVSVFRSLGGRKIPLWTPASANIDKPQMVLVSNSKPAALKAPAWPRTPAYFRATSDARYSATVRTWQARMKQRGWSIKADGYYGPKAADVCRAFQRDKRLSVDGLLGPRTFAAAWTSPVTR